MPARLLPSLTRGRVVPLAAWPTASLQFGVEATDQLTTDAIAVGSDPNPAAARALSPPKAHAGGSGDRTPGRQLSSCGAISRRQPRRRVSPIPPRRTASA